jgi:hypothetical protein
MELLVRFSHEQLHFRNIIPLHRSGCVGDGGLGEMGSEQERTQLLRIQLVQKINFRVRHIFLFLQKPYSNIPAY